MYPSNFWKGRGLAACSFFIPSSLATQFLWCFSGCFMDGFNLLSPHKALRFFFRISLLPNGRGELPRGGSIRPPKLGQGEQQDFWEPIPRAEPDLSSLVAAGCQIHSRCNLIQQNTGCCNSAHVYLSSNVTMRHWKVSHLNCHFLS